MLAFKGSAQVIFLIHLSFPALPGNTTKQGPFIKLPMKIFPTEPPGKIFDGGTNLSEISEPPFLTIVPFEPLPQYPVQPNRLVGPIWSDGTADSRFDPMLWIKWNR